MCDFLTGGCEGLRGLVGVVEDGLRGLELDGLSIEGLETEPGSSLDSSIVPIPESIPESIGVRRDGSFNDRVFNVLTSSGVSGVVCKFCGLFICGSVFLSEILVNF